MFRAALISRSNSIPQCSQKNVRSARDSLAFTAAQDEHVLLVGAHRSITATVAPYQEALYCSCRRNSAGDASRIDRFNPALALTPLPGWSIVPRAERVIPATLRSSMATS